MAKLQGNTKTGSVKGPESTLLTTLSQFMGKIDISPQQLLNAMESDPGFAASNSATSGFETMAWDEFDTQGNDMMQRVYEDRMKKAQQMEAANNAPTMAPQRGPIGRGSTVNQFKNNNNQQMASSRLQVQQRGTIQELEIDSDDSDFGDQIKKKAPQNVQNRRKASQIPTQPSRGIPIGGTLPPGMTILDMDSSDEDDFQPQRNTRGSQQQQQHRQSQLPSVRSFNKGPKVISMSYKADHATPLAQSMMMGGGMGMGFGNAFEDDMVLEELNEEEDEEDEEEESFDEDQKSVDSDFGPLNPSQRVTPAPRPALPQRPLSTPKNSGGTPPPPPPPLESPTGPAGGSNVFRPQRPTTSPTSSEGAPPPPPPMATAPVPPVASRVSIWDRAKGSAAVVGGAASAAAPVAPSKRMSLWDRAKVDPAATGTTTAAPAATTTTTTIAPTNLKTTPSAATTATTTTTSSTNTTDSVYSPELQQLTFGTVDLIPVTFQPNASSHLSQQLNESGFLRNWNKNKPEKHLGFGGSMGSPTSKQTLSSQPRAGPTKNIPIRFKFNTGLVTVSIHPTATVEEFIQESLNIYQQLGRTPALQSLASKNYNLHMWDDDEEEIDDDIPPFNRSQIVTQLDSTSLCIVPGPNITKGKALSLDLHDEPPTARTALDDFDDSYSDLFSPISTARAAGTPNTTAELATPRPFGSQREPSLLDLSSQPDVLAAISSQFSEDNLTTLDAVSAYIHQLYSIMTPTTAGKPTQYKTCKINEKGKRQDRYFGLDRYNIYNRTTPSSAFNTFSKLLNISKTERPIKSIIHVRVLPESLTTFEIDYKEDNSDTVTTRGYDVESVMICAEIVAKLRYLINNP